MDYITTSAIARTTQHLNATHARIVYPLGLCLSRLFHVTLVDAAVRLALRAKPLLSLAKSDPTLSLIWTFTRSSSLQCGRGILGSTSDCLPAEVGGV